MKNQKKIRAEFHVHTRTSKDSILNPLFLLIKCKLKKIKLIAITDHNEIKGAVKCQKMFKRFGVEVIVGEEIMTLDGEIIGLYLDEKIPENLEVEETIKRIKAQNGLIYLPHPYDEKRYKTVLESKKQIKFKDEFNFIEIHNGRNIKEEFDKKQLEIQRNLGIQPIIGSDAHTFMEVGRNYIIIDKSTKENLSENIKKGYFHQKKCIGLAHKITKIAKIIKLIEKGEINELSRIVYKKCRRKM